MIFNNILSILAFGAVLIAVRGNTWNPKGHSIFRRMTITGWVAVVIGLAILSTSLIKSHQDSALQKQRQFEAANQILSEIAPQATFYRALVRKADLKIDDLVKYQHDFRQYADFLEKKLNRYSNQLPPETARAGEKALTAQRQLIISLEHYNEGIYKEDEIRKTLERCFKSAKNLGDSVLLVLGNNEGMDGTYILTVKEQNE